MVDVLHINDNRLLLERSGETSISQGYAWLDLKQVHFDLDSSAEGSAIKRCRLTPNEVNNRYWMQCDQNAISPNAANMRHAADLIWQHLSQLKQKFNLNELILVVPSHFRAENLQLLLGVAKACGLQIKGLLNKAVLCLSSQKLSDGDYTHHDVQLHQTVTSTLNVSNGLIKLGDVQITQDVGIHLMQETLLKGLQNSFIRSDRFDPLHDAGTEQQLFDQLSQVAEQLEADGKANIGISHNGKRHNTSIDAKEWHGLLAGFSSHLRQASATRSFLDLNFAFGSASIGDLNDANILVVNQTPRIDAALLDINAEPDGDTVVYRTELSVALAAVKSKTTSGAVAEPRASSVQAKDRVMATHLLSAGSAIAISRAKVSMDNSALSVSLDSHSNLASLLNGGQLFIMNDEGRTQLKPNDRLGSHLADGVITVIQVLG